MSGQRCIEDVSVGDDSRRCEETHRGPQRSSSARPRTTPTGFHYDRSTRAVEGHPEVLVHGPLQGAGDQFVAEWAGPKGRVLNRLAETARAFPETDLTFKGRVTDIDGDVARSNLGRRIGRDRLEPGTRRSNCAPS